MISLIMCFFLSFGLKHSSDLPGSLSPQYHHGFTSQPAGGLSSLCPPCPISDCHCPAACLHHHYCKRGERSEPCKYSICSNKQTNSSRNLTTVSMLYNMFIFLFPRFIDTTQRRRTLSRSRMFTPPLWPEPRLRY